MFGMVTLFVHCPINKCFKTVFVLVESFTFEASAALKQTKQRRKCDIFISKNYCRKTPVFFFLFIIRRFFRERNLGTRLVPLSFKNLLAALSTPLWIGLNLKGFQGRAILSLGFLFSFGLWTIIAPVICTAQLLLRAAGEFVLSSKF